MCNNIDVSSNEKEFTNKICDLIKEQSNKCILDKLSFSLVLSGGRTPKRIFENLAINYKDCMDWEKIHFFWLDERCVDPSNNNSNFKLANDHLISKLNKVGSINRMKGEIEPGLAAKDYNDQIIKFFGNNEVKFDFVLLGMGEDGHVASLFPESNEMKKHNDFVLATEKKYGACRRVTLGLNLINSCSFKLLLIKGRKKLAILRQEKELPINKLTELNVFYLENSIQ